MTDEATETVRYKFAFIVDGDVGMVTLINQQEDQMKYVNCLRNNPEIVEVEQDSTSRYATLPIKFNFLNDGVVNLFMDFPDAPSHARFVACLRSNPTIIEVEPSNPVRAGWTYDGTNFNAPE